MTEQENYWDYMKRMYNEHEQYKQKLEDQLTYEEWIKTKRYAVVTAISSHRMRYVVPLDQLQEQNLNAPVSADWLADSVVMQEVEEFSQDWLGEQIVDVGVMSEESMLELFDKDNDYLNKWPSAQKIEWVRKLFRGRNK